MTEFLSKFDSGELIGLVAVAGGMLCGITAIVGGIVAKCWSQARELAFKEEMVARGMSADEIQTVMECGNHRLFANRGCRSGDRVGQA
jgi:hypothetical protein